VSDILEEVLNDEQYEKKFLLFRKTLPFVIGFVVVTSIAIASYSWYQHRKGEYNRKIGDMFVQLLNGEYGEYKTAQDYIAAFDDFSKNADNRQQEFAQLKIANLLIYAKDKEGAMKKLEEIVANKNYSEITTSLARILWINVVLDQAKISDEVQGKTRDYLQYFSEEDQPFFVTATLMKALFYKKVGQDDLAVEYADKVLNLKEASPILKDQAKAILSGIKLNLLIKESKK
jgi:hypothetical protein